MTRRHTPDPVVAKEALERFTRHEKAMATGRRAAIACAWFAEYAAKGFLAPSVVSLKAALVAGLTQGAEQAEIYIRLAAEEQAETILRRAIELAEAELDAAERVRRQERSRS